MQIFKVVKYFYSVNCSSIFFFNIFDKPPMCQFYDMNEFSTAHPLYIYILLDFGATLLIRTQINILPQSNLFLFPVRRETSLYFVTSSLLTQYNFEWMFRGLDKETSPVQIALEIQGVGEFFASMCSSFHEKAIPLQKK